MAKKEIKTKKKSTAIIVNPQSLSAEGLMNTAIQKGVTVDVMERLLTMRRELKSEKAKELFDTSMAEFQSSCPVIRKKKVVMNKDGKSKRYSFAPLEFIITQTKDLIKQCGFSYSIDTKVEDKWVEAICKVTHQAGHSETSSFKIPIDTESYMTQPQRFASALTFAKRYAFSNAFGILTGDMDDDAQTAGDDDVPDVARVAGKGPVGQKASGTTKTTPKTENDVETGIKMIKAQKDKGMILDWKAKIEKNPAYSAQDKKILLDAISARLDVLDNQG